MTPQRPTKRTPRKRFDEFEVLQKRSLGTVAIGPHQPDGDTPAIAAMRLVDGEAARGDYPCTFEFTLPDGPTFTITVE